jgi:hypothetical protein
MNSLLVEWQSLFDKSIAEPNRAALQLEVVDWSKMPDEVIANSNYAIQQLESVDWIQALGKSVRLITRLE